MQQQTSMARSEQSPAPADPGAEGHLPPAYLASWAVRGTLCAMHKVGSEIAVDAVPPDAAALLPQLGDTDLPDELKQQIGEQLAALALPDPAAALRPIVELRAAEWDADVRDKFARFIVALMLRHPSVVVRVAAAMRDILETGTREMKRRYASRRSDPRTFAEFVTRADPQAPLNAATQYLHKVIDGDAIAATIGKMQWTRITVAEARFSQLTSDQPLDAPLSLGDKNAYISLPLGPTALFVASNNTGLLDTLSRHDPSKVVRMMNMATVTRANDCVFGTDDSQLAFVKHHFGEAPTTPQLPDIPRKEALATFRRK
jgi:hypothetical protein